MTFLELGLSEEVARAITEKGYENPTDIQQQALPILLNGHDLLAQSQTGTGKTAAFGLPIVTAVEHVDKQTQALILCPTRELSMQVAEEIRSFAKYKKLSVVSIYGGAPIDRQIKDLKRGADIVVATPGRLMDHIRRRTIRLNHTTRIVLDEADEMLNMGFVDDIREIFEYLPEERQMAFFSATMPKEIIRLSDDFLVEPERIALSRNNLTVSRIEQRYYTVESNQKISLVIQLLQIHDANGIMIFCNTKKMVDELTTELNKAGFPALGLHGDMKQEMRSMVMGRFKRGMVKVLIATDVAARGIDVDSMDVVINYDVPQELEYYVHRIGRTGRAGKEGLAITLVTRRQRYAIRQIERLSNSEIKETPLPTKEQLNAVLVQKLAADIRQWSSAERGKLFDIAYEGLSKEGFTQEEIIIAFINKSVAENNLAAIKGEAASKRVQNRDQFSKIALTIGGRQGISASHLVSAIATATGIRGKDIGRIIIDDTVSTVEVPREHAASIMEDLKKVTIKGKNFDTEMLEVEAIREPRRRDRGGDSRRRDGGGGRDRGNRGGDRRRRGSDSDSKQARSRRYDNDRRKDRGR